MTEEERRVQELKNLKNNSPFALPDDPSNSGWSTAQIKEKHWMGLVILYEYLVAERARIDLATGVNGIAGIVDKISKILSGELLVAKAKNDKNGKDIAENYVTIEEMHRQGITSLKYLKHDGETTEYIYAIEEALTNLRSAYELFVSSYFENGKAKNALNAENAAQALKDDLGNVIKNTYATITSLGLTNTEIANIKNGNTVVQKAYKDQYGNTIDLVYAKLVNLNDLVKQVGFAVEGDNATITYKTKDGTTQSVTVPLATSTKAGLMSPSDVAQIATLVAKVASFEELTRRLSYTAKSNPSKAEILAFVRECGYTDERQFYGIKVIVSATSHVWVWYDNLDEFADVGVETVSQATQSSLGTVKGSNVRGKGYIENDGIISFVGYDQLNNNVAPPYSDQVTYEVGDVRIHEGVLYVCKTAIQTAESFDSSKWDVVNLKALLDKKLSKSSTNNSLYGTGNNVQMMYAVGEGAYTIPQRDAAGNIPVPIPVNDTDAASKGYVDTLGQSKQNVINASNKLNADFLDDSSSIKKTVTASEKSTWNGKQDNLGLSIVDGKICVTY